MEGRSYEELSQIYGPSAAALRKRYERARKKLALAVLIFLVGCGGA